MLADIRWTDILDIVIVAFVLWLGLASLRQTRARLAILGLMILGAVYLLARQIDLQLTLWLFSGFFATLVVVIVVVFQEDLRHLFEQIALWGLGRRPEPPRGNVVDVVVRTFARLSETRTGGLLVVPLADPVERHARGGIPLHGRVSEPLLLSLFDDSSPGHDGAVILVGQQVERFAVHLPLSSDRAQLEGLGTRHAAALGLAERTDAICVVCSEERGVISVARVGRLQVLASAADLAGVLRESLETLPPPGGSRLASLRFRWREAALGALLAATLWLFLVWGSRVGVATVGAPVSVENLSPGHEVQEIRPPRVQVRISAARRRLVLTRNRDFRVTVDGDGFGTGERWVPIAPEHVERPPGIAVEEVAPVRVRIRIAATGASDGGEHDAGAVERMTP